MPVPLIQDIGECMTITVYSCLIVAGVAIVGLILAVCYDAAQWRAKDKQQVDD